MYMNDYRDLHWRNSSWVLGSGVGMMLMFLTMETNRHFILNIVK